MSSEKNDIFHDIFKSNDLKDSFIDVYKNSRKNSFGSIPTLTVGVRFPGDVFAELKAISRDMNISLSKLSYLIISSFMKEYTRKHDEKNNDS